MICHKCEKTIEGNTSINDAASTRWCLACAGEGLFGMHDGKAGCSKPGCGEPVTDASDRIIFGGEPDGHTWHKGCAAMELARL